jgi:hypothetical protein
VDIEEKIRDWRIVYPFWWENTQGMFKTNKLSMEPLTATLLRATRNRERSINATGKSEQEYHTWVR